LLLNLRGYVCGEVYDETPSVKINIYKNSVTSLTFEAHWQQQEQQQQEQQQQQQQQGQQQQQQQQCLLPPSLPSKSLRRCSLESK